MNFSLLLTFLKALPDLLKLLNAIEANIKKAKTEEVSQRKVTDDLKQIHEAFQNGDATKLKALFNN
jgi:hypothetical protein